jgi:glycine cleavage system H protein
MESKVKPEELLFAESHEWIHVADVDGEVGEINTTLPDNLEVLNSDPYGAGWIIKVKLTDDQGLGKLLDHGAYESQCS